MPISTPTHIADLATYSKAAYLEYAMTTVTDRALPQVEDGLKPVQRRILYSMYALKFFPTHKHVKSARVVGDVLGKYHPHGDTAAYDALVRMAQNFTLRYPLIDGQGNFGTRDGDSAAAMRYTECRLATTSSLLTQHLQPGTTQYVPNYDGSEQEPYLMSARLPFVLLNGASGIAVGMATELAPHNLPEVCKALLALIENPNLTLHDIMQYIKGPDFPDGASLVSPIEDIYNAYNTGRGSLRLQATISVEPLARNQWKLVASQLPYQISTKKILEELDSLSNPKIPQGKKALSPQQLVLKQTTLSLIEYANDESDKSTPVRLVIYPSSPKTDPQTLIQFLYEHTSLQSNISLNHTIIGLDGNPAVMPLLTILQQWLTFRRELLRRRLTVELAELRHRIHILHGRQIAFLNLDAVIHTIRHSPDKPPLQQILQETFNLSEIQAIDILEMRLRQLQRLEGIKLDQEVLSLQKEIDKINRILSTPKLFDQTMSNEITSDMTAFADERRTLISPQAPQLRKTTAPLALKVDPMHITISQSGLIKGYKNTAPTFKTGDNLLTEAHFQPNHLLIALSKSGRAYSLNPSDIPTSRGDGTPLFSLITLEPKDTIHSLISLPPEHPLLLITTTGFALQTTPSSLSSTRSLKTGKNFLSDPLAFTLPLPLPTDPAGNTPQDLHLLFTPQNTPPQALPLSTIPMRPTGGKGVQISTTPLTPLDSFQVAPLSALNEQFPPSSSKSKKKPPALILLQKRPFKTDHPSLKP